MERTEHQPGIHEQYVVKRRLKLATVPAEREAALLAALAATPGVARAELDRPKQRLLVAYDASTQSLDGVVEALHKEGVVIASDWWTRLRVDWYRNADANVHENASREPWSCHKVPPK